MDKKTIRRMIKQAKFFKIKLDIFDSILTEELMKEEKKEINKGVRCQNCNCKNVRVRQKDQSYFCRSCGFDLRKKNEN